MVDCPPVGCSTVYEVTGRVTVSATCPKFVPPIVSAVPRVRDDS